MQLPGKIIFLSSISLIGVIVFGWFAFPKIVTRMVKNEKTLKEGTQIRALWTKIPFPLDFKVYLFNVTNARDVQNGDIPMLDEIGPFCYDQYKMKTDLVDDDVDDTIAYNRKQMWIFNQNKSGHLTGEEIITIPHPILVGMGVTVLRTLPSMLSLISEAIDEIMLEPKDVFLTASVRDILFDGVLINCTVTEFAAKAVCAQLKTKKSQLVEVSEDVYLFSFFGAKNDTITHQMKVKRGTQNSSDVGRLVGFQNEASTDMWSTDECNTFHGTDSTIFPPFVTKEEGLWSFAPDLCRSMGANFEQELDYFGIPTWRFTANLGDASKNVEDQCYCSNPQSCPKKGVMDLTKCVSSPLEASLPHFYLSDESYLKGVRGLHPSQDKHEIFVILEPMTGTPLSARKRLQFNIPFVPIAEIPIMANLPKTLVPILWVEEGLVLNATFMKVVIELFTTLKLVHIMKWASLCASALGIVIGIVLHYHKKKAFVVSPSSKGTAVASPIGLNDPKSSMIISTLNGSGQMELGTASKY